MRWSKREGEAAPGIDVLFECGGSKSGAEGEGGRPAEGTVL